MAHCNRPLGSSAAEPQPDDDLPLVDPGRSLGLRLLALLGAFSFLMLGAASVVIPLLQPEPPAPAPQPLQQPSSAA